MLDPHFKFLQIMENYLGCGEAICLASQYDVKTIIPLLMICFDQLNPTSQGCGTIIDVPTLHLNNICVCVCVCVCLVLKHPWSKVL